MTRLPVVELWTQSPHVGVVGQFKSGVSAEMSSFFDRESKFRGAVANSTRVALEVGVRKEANEKTDTKGNDFTDRRTL
ncbi:hypothetical protein TNCV_542451 [Trichonephila clavipes]|nr:hypothetical protein TNCV_542451 [Trichonephila clavipes]